MRAYLYFFLFFSFLLGGCHKVVKTEIENPFPIKFNLKNYTVVNYISARKEYNLDHLLELDKWAQGKGVAAGLQGDAVLALLEGRVSLKNNEADSSIKRLLVDILFSFEFKNHPVYGKGKIYFKLSEEDNVGDKEVENIQKYIQQKLVSLDARFSSAIETQFPRLKRGA